MTNDMLLVLNYKHVLNESRILGIKLEKLTHDNHLITIQYELDDRSVEEIEILSNHMDMFTFIYIKFLAIAKPYMDEIIML